MATPATLSATNGLIISVMVTACQFFCHNFGKDGNDREVTIICGIQFWRRFAKLNSLFRRLPLSTQN